MSRAIFVCKMSITFYLQNKNILYGAIEVKKKKKNWHSDSRRKTDYVSTKGINWLNRSLSSVHLESHPQNSARETCFVYALFFGALQAQLNCRRQYLTISPTLPVINLWQAKRVARRQTGTRTLSPGSCCCSKKAVPLVRKSWWLGWGSLRTPNSYKAPWTGHPSINGTLTVCVQCLRWHGHQDTLTKTLWVYKTDNDQVDRNDGLVTAKQYKNF